MKTIALGDTHGRSFWKLIANMEKYNKLVFIGDYFDSFDISGDEQIRNFKEICEFKEKHPKKVVLLIGNHDHHYFPEIGNTGTSGYQHSAAYSIGHVLSTYRDLLQMAYLDGTMLFTHAGVSETFMTETGWGGEPIDQYINDLWKHKPLSFCFIAIDGHYDRSGDNIWQSPIWIRPHSLMKDSKNFKKAGVIQIVGHTQQSQIDIKGKSTGGNYWFIDTLGTSGEYLIIENGQFKTNKI